MKTLIKVIKALICFVAACFCYVGANCWCRLCVGVLIEDKAEEE